MSEIVAEWTVSVKGLQSTTSVFTSRSDYIKFVDNHTRRCFYLLGLLNFDFYQLKAHHGIKENLCPTGYSLESVLFIPIQ